MLPVKDLHAAIEDLQTRVGAELQECDLERQIDLVRIEAIIESAKRELLIGEDFRCHVLICVATGLYMARTRLQVSDFPWIRAPSMKPFKNWPADDVPDDDVPHLPSAPTLAGSGSVH